MTLLNPVWLLLLPFVLLPLVIHLWNQSRHKVVDWGAMRFLIAAQQIRGGRQRLRHWLIMLARMLTIAGLIFLLSRPLSSGLLGTIAGGQPQTVLVLLDRSASMQQQPTLGGSSKLQSGLKTIAATLETSARNSKLYLIDAHSTEAKNDANRVQNVVALKNPSDLLDISSASSTDAESNMLTLCETALDFITNNQTGRTDIWICSDGSENDWRAQNSQWQALAARFKDLKGVRFQYLHLAQSGSSNFSVKVNRCELTKSQETPELVLDISVQSDSPEARSTEVPVTIMIGNARQVLQVPLDGGQAEVLGYRIPLAEKTERGWGYVEISNDCQPADNRAYFTFSPSIAMQTVVVAEQPSVVRPIELAASIPIDDGNKSNVVVVSVDQLENLDLSTTHLLVWQGLLPSGSIANRIEAFIQSRGTLLLLPPATPNETSFAGLKWAAWQNWDDGQRVASWDNDRELWRQSSDGSQLPIDKLVTYQTCSLTGNQQTLATLQNGLPLLTKNSAVGGGVYALTTWPLGTHSSLDKNLVAVYALVQRALESSFSKSAGNYSVDAGSDSAQAAAAMQVVVGNTKSIDATPQPASMRPWMSGVYQADGKLLAINRPAVEDRPAILPADEINKLFSGLDFNLIDGLSPETTALASEVWKSLAVLIVLALMCEAGLTMPPKHANRPLAKTTTKRVAA